MITVELVGGHLVLGDVETFGKAAGAGTVEGVRAAAAEYAKDLAAHTPVKSGKARDSIVVKESSGGKVQTIRYDYKKSKAFYMRFVVLGAKPHVIALKMRTARSIVRARQRRFRSLLKGGQALTSAWYDASMYSEGLTRKLAMTFTAADGKQVFGKRFRHPGITGTLAISGRLKATSSHLAAVIKAKADQRIATEMLKRRHGASLRPVGGISASR